MRTGWPVLFMFCFTRGEGGVRIHLLLADDQPVRGDQVSHLSVFLPVCLAKVGDVDCKRMHEDHGSAGWVSRCARLPRQGTSVPLLTRPSDEIWGLTKTWLSCQPPNPRPGTA